MVFTKLPVCFTSYYSQYHDTSGFRLLHKRNVNQDNLVLNLLAVYVLTVRYIFADDPKSQLEREVAKSLLSLSKMSHPSVSEGYVNAGLVPLNARPNTYPYKFSALSPLSSKPHTPTLTSISEQKERESVSQSYAESFLVNFVRRHGTANPAQKRKQRYENLNF